MDRMEETILVKTIKAGVLGTASAMISWLLGDQFGAALTNLAKLIGIIIALISLGYIIVINRHRNHTEELNEKAAAYRLCDRCRIGGDRPEVCPFPQGHEPDYCPKVVLKKYSGLVPDR